MKLLKRVFTFGIAFVACQGFAGEIHLENSEWSFQDDFEGSEDQHFWSSGHSSYYGVACSSDPQSSGKVQKFVYEKDVPEPGESWSEKRFRLPIKARQIEMTYRLYVPANYMPSPQNQKNYIFWSGDYGGSGSNMAVSSESWPASGGAKPSIYIRTGKAGMGHSMMRGGPNLYNNHQGGWQKIHIYIELAEKDGEYGIMEIHRNGVLVNGTQEQNIELGYSGAPPLDKQLSYGSRGNWLDQGYLLGWAKGGFREKTVFCIDDFSIKANSGILSVSQSSPPKMPTTVVFRTDS